jgi:carbamoyl-phosphate synthase small subunit
MSPVVPRVAPAMPLPADAVVDPRIGSSGPCLLALEDGAVFRGVAFGATGNNGGDLVVNTSQTGYQEVCTDPSYAGQVVVMTFPLIGNHGRFADDDQSERPWLNGLIVGHATAGVLGRARQIVHLLRSAGVPAIAGLDTRTLARHLRESGSLRGVITAPGQTDAVAAVAAAQAVPIWEEQDFVSRVSANNPYEVGVRGPVVAVMDLGLKTNIVRSLHRRGARVRVLPHTASLGDVLAADVCGVVISPGPGDPGRLDSQVELTRAVVEDGRPLLGICLGHQIVARAAGARTTRLRFGHHAANHPVRDEISGRVTVTAQNHEVQVVGDSLPEGSGFFVSQRNLNDGTVEGLRHRAKPIETVQYHPEGSPGPLDAAEVFDRFLGHVRAYEALKAEAS